MQDDIRKGVCPGNLPDDLQLSTEVIAWWNVLELCWAWDPNMRKSAEVILELLTIVQDVNRNAEPINIPKTAWEIERSLRQRIFDIEVQLEDQLAHKADNFDCTLPGDVGTSPMQLEEDFIPHSYIAPSPISTSTRNRDSSKPRSVLMTSLSNSQREPMSISPNLSATRLSMHMSISPASVSNLQRTRPQSTKYSVANPSHLRYSTLPE